jgi:RNA polymerase sigma-70 factor (ECF subfamily)
VSSVGGSDEALMQALQDGDLDAFRVLYERHHRGVFAFVLRSVGDPSTAEDLLQETFVRVFATRRAYRPLASFRTWLYTIARHLVIDRIRRRRAPGDPAEEGAVDAVVDPDASPHQRAEARELGERLERAIERLPPAQREVLLLSRVAGLGHEEIAQVTGVSPGAVRVTLHRALDRLRAVLASL